MRFEAFPPAPGTQAATTAVLAASAACQNVWRAPGSIFCPSARRRLLCWSLDALHTPRQLGCSRALRGSITVLPARMASPFTPSLRPSSPHSQPDTQPNRLASRPDPDNLAMQIVVLTCTEQPSPRQSPCQWQPAGEGASSNGDSPSVCGTRPQGAGWMRLRAVSRLSQQAPPAPRHPPALCSADSGSPGKGEKRALFWGQD